MNRLVILISLAFLSGCASQTNWTPTVDPYGNPNSYRLNQDMHECQQLAHQASGGTALETAKGVGVGALIGGASGAAIGAIAGNAGTGAAIGATAGGFGGGTSQGFRSEEQYKRAYANCLRHRGHYIIN